MGPLDTDALFAAQLAATWFMTGLIWFVQVVHYPLLAEVGPETYVRYQRAHMNLTTWVVGPPMLIEAATAAAMVWIPPAGVTQAYAWLGLGLLAGIWASTAFLQVPAHDALTRGFDTDAHRRLVRGNWIRTGLWSARALLLLTPLV